MNPTISPLRRLGATFAIAGIAALGSVALAPAASAAQPVTEQNGPAWILDLSTKPGKGGPDAFIELEHGRKAVFFCDEDKPNKQKNKCEPVVAEGGPRF